MKTIFDLGMYDASDTIYYLEEGFRVVAVEANPALVRRAQVALDKYVASGQLAIVNAAIGPSNEAIEVSICGDDLGSSSIYRELVEARTPIGKFTVQGITTHELFDRFGVPYYLKIDVEGADGLCVRALSSTTKPNYLSFEVDDDLEELTDHLASIGFTKFKLINQVTFRELTNRRNLRDRTALKIVRMLGYAEPQYVKRCGRLFKSAHSSGPAPWCSDGAWRSRDELLRKWERLHSLLQHNVWFDLHAM
jgi:FkbM family methyltransferase